MTRLLPALHEGHAPIHLHHIFSEALAAFEAWTDGSEEPMVEFEGSPVLISSIFGRMRTCTDLLPVRILDDAIALLPPSSQADAEDWMTYADAARVMRALSVKRLRVLANH